MSVFAPNRLTTLTQAAAPAAPGERLVRAPRAVRWTWNERFVALAFLGVGAATGALVYRGLTQEIPPLWQMGALGGGWIAIAAMALSVAVSSRLRVGRLLSQANEALERFIRDPHEAKCDLLRQWRPDEPAWRMHFDRLADALDASQRQLLDGERRATGQNVRVHQLEEEVEEFREFLQRLDSPLAAVDAYGEVRFANDAFRAAFLPTGDAGHTPRLESISSPALMQFLAEILQHHRVQHRTREMLAQGSGGAERWYRVSCQRLRERSPGGDSILLVALSNIDEQKSVHRRNAEFVSNVAHEMKTPLAGIKAYVELLADGGLDAETRDSFLETIDVQTDRLKRLIDNLLNMARIEAGVVHVAKEPISLNACLEEAARIVQPSAAAKQIDLKIELTSLYVNLYADRDLLMQAALNLLSNAVKYTPDGGTVTLRSMGAEGEAIFEVSDTGVGLDEVDRVRVFEKFYRVRKDSHMAPGTGLGLALVKLIVEDVHGGRLTVDSELGKGSSFRATFRTA
ncbi:MAG TPA: HAMP domain-containing sensor histidine kinase [Pirellulaceae bacterium]|jgi:two-component system phosphate regulon sensor histidine kinase PhoR|nr:HAMP domain-containing sensor histidine kinase [Pirellulaceae bacterium]